MGAFFNVIGFPMWVLGHLGIWKLPTYEHGNFNFTPLPPLALLACCLLFIGPFGYDLYYSSVHLDMIEFYYYSMRYSVKK